MDRIQLYKGTTSVCTECELMNCFSIQDLCLENIGKDLHHYFTFLAAQSDPDKLIDPTLSGLRELMQVNHLPLLSP